MTDPDRKLAKQAARGDSSAVAALYERNRGRVFGFLVRVCGRQAAEDVFQEVWIRVMRKVGAFDPRRGTFRAWVLVIAMHAAIDRMRRGGVRAAEPLDVPQGEDGPPRMERVESREPSAERGAMSAELGDALERALDRLAPARRAAVLLRHHAGMSYGEIADALGVAEGTAKSMVHRGVIELRDRMGDWFDERS